MIPHSGKCIVARQIIQMLAGDPEWRDGVSRHIGNPPQLSRRKIGLLQFGFITNDRLQWRIVVTSRTTRSRAGRKRNHRRGDFVLPLNTGRTKAGMVQRATTDSNTTATATQTSVRIGW